MTAVEQLKIPFFLPSLAIINTGTNFAVFRIFARSIGEFLHSYSSTTRAARFTVSEQTIPYTMDGKLTHIVKKYLQSCEDQKPSDETVIDHILSTHTEYQRKTQAVFRKHAVQIIHKVQESLSSGTTSPKKGLKRKKSTSAEESKPSNLKVEPVSPGNMLNSSLHRSYNGAVNKAKALNNAEESNPNSAPSSTRKRKMRKKSKAEEGPGSDNEGAPGGGGGGSSIVERPSARYSDIGGIESVLQEVRQLIEYPLSHPEIYAELGVEPPRGILLHGPPGCGKTLLANAVAGT